MDFFVTEATEKRLKAIYTEEKLKAQNEYAHSPNKFRKAHGTFDRDEVAALATAKRAYQLGCSDNY